MLLQVNDSGAWRNAVRFKGSSERPIREAGLILAEAGDLKALRIIDDGIVIAYCERPEPDAPYEWTLP